MFVARMITFFRGAHNQGLQELDKAEQKEGDDDQGEDQANDSPGNVPHSREGTSELRVCGLGFKVQGLGLGFRVYVEAGHDRHHTHNRGALTIRIMLWCKSSCNKES